MFRLLSARVLEGERILVETHFILLLHLDRVYWHPWIFVNCLLKGCVKIIIRSVVKSHRAVRTFWLHTDVRPRRARLVVGEEDVSESRVSLVGRVIS